MFGDLFPQALVGTPPCREIRQAYRRSVAGISCQILRFDFEKARDDRRGLLPIAGLCLQLLAAGRGKTIEARAAVVFRCAPLRSDRAFMLQLQQQGIERALVDMPEGLR